MEAASDLWPIFSCRDLARAISGLPVIEVFCTIQAHFLGSPLPEFLSRRLVRNLRGRPKGHWGLFWITLAATIPYLLASHQTALAAV